MRFISFIDLVSLVAALRWTVGLTLIAVALGGPLGLVLALMKASRARLLDALASAILQLIQGIPLLALLMFFYFGVPVFLGINIPPLAAVSIAYVIFTGVYFGQIWGGSILAIKQEQWEAGACLGLRKVHQFFYIIMPQAFKISLPASVSFLVQLVKGTSLASVVGFVELTRAAQEVSAATFQSTLTYTTAAALYFLICFPLTLWSRRLEKSLDGTH
ncbi:MAG: amino acid ABC transporter permease [Castellaniella sp.]|uniref:amino acid ABC transporter permease n=1 Tax=Castellaniella sp. TaxID=1955812 RepID=UPI0011FEC647|nr:amino acid ABC transporter permease [Castellaniella sp.]TAN25822.1 MAG: amino acid ABC transporter permease [Castellaniella sp.]